MKRLIVDLDGTLCHSKDGNYDKAIPVLEIINKLREYKKNNFEIIINTSRNVRTYKGNLGKINANTLPIILDWLDRHKVPYDEVYVGKPWCGFDGFYIDDRAVRPNEFINMSYNEIDTMLGVI
jgi:capsule biosynthesis phosphatase